MLGRDPEQPHRASTPLELLFDLTFVVAVAQAAGELHHALTEAHLWPALAGYAAVFFAIWWAWMNFTWFASAYDTDDAPYRVLTLLQMGGVLVLAAGVAPAFEHGDFTVVVIGYVIMRIALVTQWLRAAAAHVAGRPAALRYAVGVVLVQCGWIARLWTDGAWAPITFLALVLAELAVPAWAEARGRATRWHPGHIAERYGLFTIIVLGEVILAVFTAVRVAVTERGLSGGLLMLVIGGLLLVFALWWTYFTGPDATLADLRTALGWGYGHYLVFAGGAALGAGLAAAVDALDHHAHLSTRGAGLAVAVPAALVLLVLGALHRLAGTGARVHIALVVLGAAVILALGLGAPALGLGGAVLAMGLALATTLAAGLVVGHRRHRRIA